MENNETDLFRLYNLIVKYRFKIMVGVFIFIVVHLFYNTSEIGRLHKRFNETERKVDNFVRNL